MSDRRVRLTVDERRTQVVAAASALITERGYHRFSIAELARRCDMTRAGLLHHFPSKEHVLLAVIQHHDLEEAATLAVEESWLDGSTEVRAVLDRIVQRLLERPELVRLYAILGVEALDADHPAHRYFADRHAGFIGAFGPYLGADDRDGAAVALELIAFMDGLQLAWLRDPTLDLHAHWDAFADRVLPRTDPPDHRSQEN